MNPAGKTTIAKIRMRTGPIQGRAAGRLSEFCALAFLTRPGVGCAVLMFYTADECDRYRLGGTDVPVVGAGMTGSHHGVTLLVKLLRGLVGAVLDLL